MEELPLGRAEIKDEIHGVDITPEEKRFLAEYAGKLDCLVDKINAHRGGEISGLLKQLLRPDAWRVLLNLSKAEKLMTKAWLSEHGQEVLVSEEAQDTNREYDRRADAVVRSLREFTDFVDRANGRSASIAMEEGASSEG